MVALDKFGLLAALAIAAGGGMAARHVTQDLTPMCTPPAGAGVVASTALTRGTVLKIDADADRITIEHDAIGSLGMPRMTMVYRTAHAGLLGKAKVGQAIGFRAERIDGAFVVTRLQAL